MSNGVNTLWRPVKKPIRDTISIPSFILIFIYKIGKTKQSPKKRLSGYPKNSEVIQFTEVDDCHKYEQLIKSVFNDKFKLRKDIGIEYFEGNRNEIIQTFNECANGTIINHKQSSNSIIENYSKNFVKGLKVIFK